MFERWNSAYRKAGVATVVAFGVGVAGLALNTTILAVFGFLSFGIALLAVFYVHDRHYSSFMDYHAALGFSPTAAESRYRSWYPFDEGA